jgi:hypothetical protein
MLPQRQAQELVVVWEREPKETRVVAHPLLGCKRQGLPPVRVKEWL